MKSDYCKYVDVFYGNGETDRFFDEGLASKWFYIKALCGNTIPHATLPFGKMSVGAYSGGYPTGYGTHYPNSCGGIQKLAIQPVAKGFSHLHQSGTGAMRYYYNYAIVTPFYGEDLSVLSENQPLENEEARPGYYKTMLNNTLCELTVDGGVALHRYTFLKKGGRLAVDFSNNGLDKSFGSARFSEVKNLRGELISNNVAIFSGEYSGVKLYFCVKIECQGSKVRTFVQNEKADVKNTLASTTPIGVIFDFESNIVVMKVGYSTISNERAMQEVEAITDSFDAIVDKSYEIWNEHLSAFEIQTPNVKLKEKFYSCLYHSIVKPCDMTGETVLGVSDDTVVDFASFWDQYKTALPLIYMSYPTIGEKIVKAILNISRTLGKIPCSFGLSDVFPCEEQAKMLGIYTILDAYHFGMQSITLADIEECMERELNREDYNSFLDNGYFMHYTHILDVTDACLDVAELTTNVALKAKLIQLSKHWSNAYSEDGLMSENSEYYEGDRYTYSFRIQANMEERVRLAGGKKHFCAMLDDFFGFGKESVKQLTHIGALKEISKCHYHRFEGFNNECDMETPYAYIYADRHDRLCEIIRECTTRSFGSGKSALPGNNDSGGLSSMFVWNVLGLFPVSGSGKFLLGAPQIDRAKIKLSSGKTLIIRTIREHSEQIYVSKVEWNGKPIDNYQIQVELLMYGGELTFYMQ